MQFSPHNVQKSKKVSGTDSTSSVSFSKSGSMKNQKSRSVIELRKVLFVISDLFYGIFEIITQIATNNMFYHLLHSNLYATVNIRDTVKQPKISSFRNWCIDLSHVHIIVSTV